MNTHGHTPHTHTLMAEAQSSAIGVYAGSHIQLPLTKDVGGRNKAQGRPGLKKRAGLGGGKGAGDIEVQPEHRGYPNSLTKQFRLLSAKGQLTPFSF